MSTDLDGICSDEEVKFENFENWLSRSDFMALFHEIYYSASIFICLGKAENQYIRALDSSRLRPRSSLHNHPVGVTKEYCGVPGSPCISKTGPKSVCIFKF